MRHTPGKWEMIDGNFVYALNENDINRFSCSIQGGYSAQGKKTSKEELAANAALISASPDLLAACKAAYSVLLPGYPSAEREKEFKPVRNLLTAVIKAAEGES